MTSMQPIQRVLALWLSLYDALVSVNIPADKARAVVAALEQEMGTMLATKPDLEHLRHELHGVRNSIGKDLVNLEQKLQIKLGYSWQRD